MFFSLMSNNMLDMCVGVGEVAVALLLPRAGVAEFRIFPFFCFFFVFIFIVFLYFFVIYLYCFFLVLFGILFY